MAFHPTEEAPRKRKRSRANPYLMPGAIVLSGILVASAFFITSNRTNQSAAVVQSQQGQAGEASARPITAQDRVRGNPNAPIQFVVYTDYECPFCATFHATLDQIMQTYGRAGHVAYAYRHFPIQELHENAWTLAIAAECAGEVGGNDAFWQYSDLIFQNTATASGEPLNLSLLPQWASQIGINREAFSSCVDSERTRPRVQTDHDEAVNDARGRGTPHNILMAGGQSAAMPGAYSYDQLKIVFDTILEQLARQQQ
jgi:protein-disulfide isomerase